MITDKQFDDAFTAAGGWFFLTQYEIIANWKKSKSELVDLLYLQHFDEKRTGTNTRVSSSIRIIENGRGKEALVKIRDSERINSVHPRAKQLATELLQKYYS